MGEILGATVVAERAGDMLAELTLAVQNHLGLAAIARTVHPYPTLGEAVQQCALNYNRARWEKLGEKKKCASLRRQLRRGPRCGLRWGLAVGLAIGLAWSRVISGMHLGGVSSRARQ